MYKVSQTILNNKYCFDHHLLYFTSAKLWSHPSPRPRGKRSRPELCHSWMPPAIQTQHYMSRHQIMMSLTFSSRYLTQAVCPSQMAASTGVIPCLSVASIFAPWISFLLFCIFYQQHSTHLGDQELSDLELSVVPGVVESQAAVYISVDIETLESCACHFWEERRIIYLSLDHLLHLIQVSILHSPGKITHVYSENMDFYCVGVLMIVISLCGERRQFSCCIFLATSMKRRHSIILNWYYCGSIWVVWSGNWEI